MFNKIIFLWKEDRIIKIMNLYMLVDCVFTNTN
jgi:hypothetical protein